MFTQAQFVREFPVRQAFRYKTRHGFFALRKKICAPSVLEVHGFHPGKRFNQITEVLANGPDSPPMHRVDAFQESFERLVAKDHSVSAATNATTTSARSREASNITARVFSFNFFDGIDGPAAGIAGVIALAYIIFPARPSTSSDAYWLGACSERVEGC